MPLGFGIFTGSWLAYSLASMQGPPGHTSSTGPEHAAGIVGLVFVGIAAYVGLATLLEDSARRTILPIGRRGEARAVFAEGIDAQLDALEHEAGVREQL